MTTKTVSVDVEIELDDFTEEELIEALGNLGYNCVKQKGYGVVGIYLEDLYNLKSQNSPDFDKAFAEYVYQELGRIL